MAPYRFYCTAVAICDDINEAATSDGMPLYISIGIELIEWSKKQHVLIQLFTYASFRMILLLASTILMACSVLIMIPAFLLSGGVIFQMQRVISNILTIGVII